MDAVGKKKRFDNECFVDTIIQILQLQTFPYYVATNIFQTPLFQNVFSLAKHIINFLGERLVAGNDLSTSALLTLLLNQTQP